VEGPRIEKLVKEVQQAVVQSTTDIIALQVELDGLHNKIKAPAE